jgi:hypothetical protein
MDSSVGTRATHRSARIPWTVWLAIALAILATVPSAQTGFGVTEIADYRLRADVFAQFDRASRLIASVTRADPRFEREPLFTEEVLLSGDVLPMAIALEARLRNDPALADALRTARLAPQEYTKFTLALVAARLAHGFVKSGAIRAVPEGVHADNVAFVDAHLVEVEAVLRELGVD